MLRTASDPASDPTTGADLGARPGTGKTKVVQETHDSYLGRTELELRAGTGIEHPSRHDRDNARSNLDVNHLAVRPPLAVLPPQTPAVQRMPAVVNDHLSPDMGRMDP
jgi:hypothetical protein